MKAIISDEPGSIIIEYSTELNEICNNIMSYVILV